jgi:hypothetical protein
MGCLQSLKVELFGFSKSFSSSNDSIYEVPRSNCLDYPNLLVSQKEEISLPIIELISISFQENNDSNYIRQVFKIENDKKNNLFHVCGIRSI